jgi:anthranilate phosphoribosyltransferase
MIFFDGQLSDEEIRSYLIELYEKGESAAEIAGAASAMREHSILLPIPYHLEQRLIDNCGTGGDKSNSFQCIYNCFFTSVSLWMLCSKAWK